MFVCLCWGAFCDGMHMAWHFTYMIASCVLSFHSSVCHALGIVPVLEVQEGAQSHMGLLPHHCQSEEQGNKDSITIYSPWQTRCVL